MVRRKKVKHQHRPDQINKNNIFVHRPQLVNFVTTTTKHDDKCIINIPMHAMAKLAPHGCNSRKDEITVDITKRKICPPSLGEKLET